ncbi:MAG: sulfotransferase [Erythrobacter sp.]
MAKPTRDHLLARGIWAERANAFLTKAWAKEWLPPPVLEPDALWEVASKPFGARAEEAELGGRSADDAADFRLRLEKLTDAIDGEANLNPLGRAMAFGQLVRVIRNRMRLGDYWKRNPLTASGAKLAAPIIVIGHMRSGTTRIHKLLAADPAHSHTRYCDAWRPAPGNLVVRRMKGTFDLKMLEWLNPWLQSIHPMQSGGVEEELAWLAGALNHSIYETQWRIPSYSAFSEARDATPVYTEFKRILATDAVHRGIADRARVIKAPQFSEDLTTLLSVLPNARVVIAERNYDAVLSSAVSLAANQMAIQSDSCDLAEIEKLWRHKIALREERIAEALTSWNGPVTRLHFDALNADWETEMARAYRELDLILRPDALAAMRDSVAKSVSGHHLSHSEQLDRFETQK